MKELNNKKVCLLYAGGTKFGADFDQKKLERWLDDFFELKMMARIDPYFVWHGSGADTNWKIATELAKLIKEKYNEYDGFIITHSIDNIAYISSLTAFMVQKTGKPIIFVGSAIVEQKNDAFFKNKKDLSFVKLQTFNIRSGVLNAVQIATMDMSGVALIIGSNIVNAVSAQLNWSNPFNCLTSFKNKFLAKINFGVKLLAFVEKRKKQKPIFNFKFDDNIKILDYYPGFEIKDDLNKYNGIFINGLQEEIASSNLNLPKNIPVCIYSYYSKTKNNNIILVNGLTRSTALAKFIWALGQTKDIDKLKEIMTTNLVGEF